MNHKQILGYTVLGAMIMPIGIGSIVSPPLIAQRDGVFGEIECSKLTVVNETWYNFTDRENVHKLDPVVVYLDIPLEMFPLSANGFIYLYLNTLREYYQWIFQHGHHHI